jgi:hypothetical protein
MSRPKPIQDTPKQPEIPPTAPASGLIASWVNFWFSPVDPIGLHALRVMGGLVFLLWLLPFAGDHQAFFALNGWFDTQAYGEASRLPEMPPHLFGWSVTYLVGANPYLLGLVYWLSIAAVAFFTLGLWTRITGCLTWVAVVSYTANPAIAYDADPLLLMLAFYLMLGYLLLGLRAGRCGWRTILFGQKESWLFHRPTTSIERPPVESVGANLALRLFQIHFAIAMVASGLHKLQVKEWWSGLAPWFYINTPFQTSLEIVRSYGPQAQTYLTFFSQASFVALAWQLAFPAFAWRPRWRFVLVGGALLGWLACAYLGLPLFGPILTTAALAYLSPGEWRQLIAFPARFVTDRSLAQLWTRAPQTTTLVGPKGGRRNNASSISVEQSS